MAESSVFKIALLQTQVLDNVDDNLTSCAGMVENAKLQGADIAVLPEMFCCPYNNVSFVKNAEKKGDRIYTALSKMAKDNNIILVGGSMPERDGDKLFNTCFVFDNKGKQIARHCTKQTATMVNSVMASSFGLNLPSKGLNCGRSALAARFFSFFSIFTAFI